MSRCCSHQEEEHVLLATCQEVVHYPSEDYPCLCTGFSGESERCAECGHARAAHVIARVCKPAEGGYCDCRAA